MTSRVAVIGAGLSGLAGAIRLAQRGHGVTLFEARSTAGGLASSLRSSDVEFDGGPYILLDRPGLSWAFRQLDLDLERELALVRIEPVYEVRFPDNRALVFHRDVDETAAGVDALWPGSGRHYRELVRDMSRIYRDTRPLLLVSRPRIGDVLRSRAFRHLPFLLRGLDSVLHRSGLPPALVDALTVWTRISGGRLAEAPSLLALIPALFHGEGAFYPQGGMAAIVERLSKRLASLGVDVRFDTPVRNLAFREGSRARVRVDAGEIEFDAVLSAAGGLTTYLELVDDLPTRARRRLEQLPLQSPGVCLYLRARAQPQPPYLRFLLGDGGSCRLLVQPAALGLRGTGDETHLVRVIAPSTTRDEATTLSELLSERGWKELAGDFEIVATRVPSSWGREFTLYRDAMNPQMTARLLRRGRLAHRSPYFDRLYLAGSSTHPGQWMSFCAISGVLAADTLDKDWSGCFPPR